MSGLPTSATTSRSRHNIRDNIREAIQDPEWTAFRVSHEAGATMTIGGRPRSVPRSQHWTFVLNIVSTYQIYAVDIKIPLQRSVSPTGVILPHMLYWYVLRWNFDLKCVNPIPWHNIEYRHLMLWLPIVKAQCGKGSEPERNTYHRGWNLSFCRGWELMKDSCPTGPQFQKFAPTSGPSLGVQACQPFPRLRLAAFWAL